ncbi:Putative transposase of IS4/5 family [Bradyrhizobium lablabi]|uniref:Putative transposase of IS4/5 family n=1 Tax=Bradyrhizobium lablabi TaxID=722472 RepID=A0A1M6JFM6_9BRAD|nr:Putative transposase of IS4/5 family [Bradyrhizobium lablabi]
MKRYGSRDDQFARIETLLPGRPGTVGRSSELGNRLFVEAVIWKFRSGAPWRDSSVSSMPSSIIEVSRHATKKLPATSLPDCTWSARSLGSNDDRP